MRFYEVFMRFLWGLSFLWGPNKYQEWGSNIFKHPSAKFSKVEGPGFLQRSQRKPYFLKIYFTIDVFLQLRFINWFIHLTYMNFLNKVFQRILDQNPLEMLCHALFDGITCVMVHRLEVKENIILILVKES